MKYLGALAISAMLFLGMVSPSMNINFWHKLLYNKEETKEKKKKDFKISIIIWAILTAALFIFVIFFVD